MNMVNQNRLSPRLSRAASFLAGCFIAAAGAATVHAEPAGSVPKLVVKYDAEMLATRSGALSLYRRIDQAAHSVCDDGSTRDLGAMARARECRREAVTRAVQRVNDPRLAEVMLRDERRG